MNTKEIGIAEIIISDNDGIAAWAKKASEEYDHMSVVSVRKSRGDNINTAGSSFIVTKNTMAKPAIIPGRNNGRVIFVEVLMLPKPKVLDDSSRDGLICNIVLLTAPKPVGRYKIKQPKISTHKDW